jgi:hypothetical protein
MKDEITTTVLSSQSQFVEKRLAMEQKRVFLIRELENLVKKMIKSMTYGESEKE